MKKILFSLFTVMFFAVGCSGQTGSFNNVQIYNNLRLNGRTITGISNDSSFANADSNSLPTSWAVKKFVSSSGNAWGLKGNSGTNPAADFIGTTDTVPVSFRINNTLSGFIGTDTFGTSANTSLGYKSLQFSTPAGSWNTAMGTRSLSSNTTGYANVGIGGSSLRQNTTGSWSVAVGTSALYSNTTGAWNTAVGGYSLYANTIGNYNVAAGESSLAANTTGGWNVAIGVLALSKNTIGQENTASGYKSMFTNTSGSWNTAYGEYSLYLQTTGSYNDAFGFKPLYNNTTGVRNTAIGSYAQFFNTTGSNNTSLGNHSLYNNTADYNTAIGDSALLNNTTGKFNIGIGYMSGNNNATASNTLYISDSTSHGYWKLDSATGAAPNVIGKDGSGYWHVYQAPSGGGASDRPYKVYTALITQSGTDAPIANVLENTLGTTVTWTRVGAGYYKATISTGLFMTAKLAVFISPVSQSPMNTMTWQQSTNNDINFFLEKLDGTFIDGLNFNPVEIRVYNP